MTTISSLHERDFYGWVEQQCAAQRAHDSSRLGVLLGHLLKWQLQPERRTRRWFLSVREQRRAIARLLEQNPSLASKLDEALSDGYQSGVDLVLRETDLSLRSLPPASPWTLPQALDAAVCCDTRGDWSDLGL